MAVSSPGRPGSGLAAALEDGALWSGDPHPLLARLRAEAPVVWNEELGYWAVARHADVLAVETDHATFSAGRGIMTYEIADPPATPPTIMHTDPPAHTRYRKLVQPAFRPSIIRSLEPVVRARAVALCDAFAGGGVVDVVPALSVPLPIQLIAEMLGLPEDQWERCFEWSEAVIPGATDWPAERRGELLGEMTTYLLEATAERRRAPRDDVISVLARAEIDGDSLSEAEVAMFLIQLLVAGNETTRNMLSAGLVAFAEHPGEWARLRAEPALVPHAVEEMLRWSTPVISFMRTATRDAEVGGQAVAAGEPVLMLFASANRDEEAFGPTVGRFDVGRDPNPHLSFGFATHFCLGVALARLEGRVVLEELAARFADVVPGGALDRSTSSVIAGIRRAELELVPV